jgi:hypothetical protein
MYPEYSHFNQAMSELHAIGSPTQTISPFLNNYPLGIFFIGFGFFVYFLFSSPAAKISAAMIILHGLGSIVAGYFPCDTHCNPESTLKSQAIHGASAVIMTITFLIAPAIWVFLSKKLIGIGWFAWASLACLAVQILLMPVMAYVLESGVGFGLIQRIAYGVPLL